MDIKEIYGFLNKYKKGEYIYYGVLHRFFRNKATEVANYLVKNGLATEETFLRCPVCDFRDGKLSDYVNDNSYECNVTYCSACGAEYRLDNEDAHDTVWVRTDKLTSYCS